MWIRLTGCVLFSARRCDGSTLAGCTSRSLLSLAAALAALSARPSSSQPDSHRSPSTDAVVLSARACVFCVCLRACAPPVRAQRDCQSGLRLHSHTSLASSAFSPLLSLSLAPLPFSARLFFFFVAVSFNGLLKSTENALHPGEWPFNYVLLRIQARSVMPMWNGGNSGILDEGLTHARKGPDGSQAPPHDVMSARASTGSYKSSGDGVCFSLLQPQLVFKRKLVLI